MEIRNAGVGELKDLIGIYKQVFKKHNVFEKREEEILNYLKREKEILVALVDNKVVGGIVIRKFGWVLQEKHGVFKYRHTAVNPEFSDKGIGSALVKAADKKIKDLIEKGEIKTAKIEIGVSENEKDALEFWKKQGFEVEGELKSHYRHGELAYSLGKEITE